MKSKAKPKTVPVCRKCDKPRSKPCAHLECPLRREVTAAPPWRLGWTGKVEPSTKEWDE